VTTPTVSFRLPKSAGLLDQNDRLAPFEGPVSVIRVAVLIATAFLVLLDAPKASDGRAVIGLGVVIMWTIVRMLSPIVRIGNERLLAVNIVLDLALPLVLVCFTGYWSSPLVLCLLPGIVIGGFAHGGPLVVGYGSLVGVIVSLIGITSHGTKETADLATASIWMLALVVVAALAGVGHRVVRETDRRKSADADAMGQLTRANQLLGSLHQLAQSLPASLDLEDALARTSVNAQKLLAADGVALFLYDNIHSAWTCGRADGLRVPESVELGSLPTALRHAISTKSVASSTEHDGATLLDDRATGLYIPLIARTSLIGAMAVEWIGDRSSGLDDTQQRDVLRSLAEPAAIGIDNARLFLRIRGVAASEERSRIARDLHDRIGQSLAYLGFELDRAARTVADPAVATELTRLRTEVSRVIAEVRETLYDIRTEVEQGNSFVTTLEQFLSRVSERASLTIDFRHHVVGALPPRQEREMWHIAQEAVVNVERHARARNVWIRWETDGHSALLEIQDDGKGYAASEGRRDSYGLRGLQERATSIGARADISSQPGQGTTVRCRLEGL
jgi:signal transduction histidine kinase